MIRISIFIIHYMLLCQNLFSSTPMRSIFDTNQFLSLSPQHFLHIQNTCDRPINMSVIISKMHTLQSGEVKTFESPDDSKELVFWQTTDISGFPEIRGKGKSILLKNRKSAPWHAYISYEEIFTIQAFGEHIIEATDNYAIKFITTHDYLDIYVNVDESSETKINLMTTPRLAWSATRRLHDFREDPHHYSHPTETTPSDFRDVILPQSGINMVDFYQKIQDSYDQNLTHIQEYNVPESKTPRIPKEMNIIWLTDINSPRYPNQQFYTLLLETMKVCPPQTTPEYGLEGGFTYTLWVNPIESLPFLKLQPLAGLNAELERYITVKDITTINMPSHVSAPFKVALQAKNYGEASDILRYIILLKGGFYIDTDYVFKRSPWRLCYALNFFSGMEEPHSCAACNAMIATSPNHPIIHQCLDLIKEYSKAIPPQYITQQKQWKSHIQTLFKTGPFMFSLAFFLACGEYDVLFQGSVFYPSLNNKTESIHNRLGEHYHTMSWIKPIMNAI